MDLGVSSCVRNTVPLLGQAEQKGRSALAVTHDALSTLYSLTDTHLPTYSLTHSSLIPFPTSSLRP